MGKGMVKRAASYRTVQNFLEAEAERVKQQAESAGAEEGFVGLRTRSARAANALVLLLQEKATAANGEIGPEEFKEGLTELGVCGADEDTRGAPHPTPMTPP